MRRWVRADLRLRIRFVCRHIPTKPETSQLNDQRETMAHPSSRRSTFTPHASFAAGETSDRPMHASAIARLKQDIFKLHPDAGAKVVSFLDQRCPQAVAYGEDDEVEADFDKVSPKTLHELRSMVDRLLASTPSADGDSEDVEEADELLESEAQEKLKDAPAVDSPVASTATAASAASSAAASAAGTALPSLVSRLKRKYGPAIEQELELYRSLACTSALGTKPAPGAAAVSGVGTGGNADNESDNDVPPVPPMKRGEGGGKHVVLSKYMLKYCVDRREGMQRVNEAMVAKLFDSTAKSRAVELVLQARPDIEFVRRGRIYVLQTKAGVSTESDEE